MQIKCFGCKPVIERMILIMEIKINKINRKINGKNRKLNVIVTAFGRKWLFQQKVFVDLTRGLTENVREGRLQLFELLRGKTPMKVAECHCGIDSKNKEAEEIIAVLKYAFYEATPHSGRAFLSDDTFEQKWWTRKEENEAPIYSAWSPWTRLHIWYAPRFERDFEDLVKQVTA